MSPALAGRFFATSATQEGQLTVLYSNLDRLVLALKKKKAQSKWKLPADISIKNKFHPQLGIFTNILKYNCLLKHFLILFSFKMYFHIIFTSEKFPEFPK